MELYLILTGDSEILYLHGLQRFSEEYFGKLAHVLRIIITTQVKDENKTKELMTVFFCTQAHECDRKLELLCSDNTTTHTNIFSGSDVPRCVPSSDTASNSCSSRYQKRKVSALVKKALEHYGFRDKQSLHETQGLETYTFECILSIERGFRHRSRYSSIQQRFLDWRISSEINTAISAPQIINFLAEIYTVEKLKAGSIKAYKSALLNLAENSAEFSSHPMLAEFTKTLDDASIVSFVRPVLDIAPVLDTFKEWGPTSDLTVKRLTAKLCWLLSVTGLRRPSDIHRIDDERSQVTLEGINLVIVATKEKQASR
ncbi:hypothetical protein AYI70_g6559 [Smittium culicis]|uniref:Core-binding (CB) domain-containing protein n=1 Tax=Smittium culicis TaxID=133412 RepID=A0A1R1XPC5_9FUNG|nr:hypothetical protein AYI70_g6559 [Smittium culicis]